MNPQRTLRTPATRAALVLVAVLANLCAGGCQRPLFDPKAPRSQFDRADSVRATRADQWIVNEYGSRRPNIRGRLIQ